MSSYSVDHLRESYVIFQIYIGIGGTGILQKHNYCSGLFPNTGLLVTLCPTIYGHPKWQQANLLLLSTTILKNELLCSMFPSRHTRGGLLLTCLVFTLDCSGGYVTHVVGLSL